MAKSDMDKLTEEKIGNGGLLLKLYFDMKNKEKESLQPLLVDLINEHLLKEPGVVYCYGAIEEPIEMEGVYSTSATITILVENFRSSINIEFRYAPAGVELIRPTKDVNLRPIEIQGALMDISLVSESYSKFIVQNAMTEEGMRHLSDDISNRIKRGTEMINRNGEDEKKG